MWPVGFSSSSRKSNPRLTQDIAYIYEILHCNHFIILSNAIAYETSTSPTSTTSCFWAHTTCSGIAENDEVVAVEDLIDVGNILDMSWVTL